MQNYRELNQKLAEAHYFGGYLFSLIQIVINMSLFYIYFCYMIACNIEN